MNNSLKYLGIGILLLGALMALVAFIPDLRLLYDQPFNWYISLSLLLVIAGLVLHIVLNKRLPLSDEEETEPVVNVVEEKSNLKVNAPAVEKKAEDTVVKVKKQADQVEKEVTKVLDKAEAEVTQVAKKADEKLTKK